jgi:hypothetical protein
MLKRRMLVRIFTACLMAILALTAETDVMSEDRARYEASEEISRAQSDWLAATKKIADISGKKFYRDIFSYLQKRSVLCEPLENGLITTNKDCDMLTTVCLVPFMKAGEKDKFRSGFEKPGVAFFDPNFSMIGLDCTEQVSSFGRATALLREAYEMMSFDYHFFNWDSIDAFCWTKINTLGFELELYSSLGKTEFDVLRRKNLDDLKKETAKNNGLLKVSTAKILEYSKNLDPIFGLALSDLEREERGTTYFLFLAMEYYQNYGERLRFLKEFYKNEQQ